MGELSLLVDFFVTLPLVLLADRVSFRREQCRSCEVDPDAVDTIAKFQYHTHVPTVHLRQLWYTLHSLILRVIFPFKGAKAKIASFS